MILASTSATQAKMVRPETSHPPNSDAALALTPPSLPVPQVLRCCSEFIEAHGVVDGIYRLSGVSSNIQRLR